MEPPLLVAGLGLLAHEQSAFRAALLALDGRTHVPVRFGEVAAAHIVVVAASVLRDTRINAGLRGRLVIVYRHESDAPGRGDDIVINAPVRVAQLGEALNAAFDRLGAAIRSEPSRAAAQTTRLPRRRCSRARWRTRCSASSRSRTTTTRKCAWSVSVRCRC